MDIEIAESEIVAHLITKITGVNLLIIPLPETEDGFVVPFGKVQIIVAFTSEEPTSTRSISAVAQDVTQTFSILIQAKKLRGERGVYAFAKLVKKFMSGFALSHGNPMVYSGQKFVNNDRDIFEHVIEYKTTGMVIQETFPVNSIGGDLNQVTYTT